MSTVLYVDDEPINCSMFELNFKKYYHVLLAESGMEALDVLNENKQVDVIVSDMKMPGMDGLEFIQKVKETNKGLPCFILTGYDLTQDLMEAIKNGIVVKYFQKPMNNTLLRTEIAKVLP